MLYSPILSILRIFPLILWVISCLTVHFVNYAILKRNFFIFFNIFFKGLLHIFGIKVKVSGKIDKNRVLYVSNHISYLDIFILGSITKGLFVAKSEIKFWPLINKITALGRTIFVNRRRKLSIKDQVKLLSKFLKKNENLILFPEGTSSDGSKVLPFKSSLFSLVELEQFGDFKIQPISIFYSKIDGMPVEKKFRPFFAWFGNMDLVSHAWKFLGLGLSEVNITYHKPIKFNSFKDRKEASNICQKIISEQVSLNCKKMECVDKIKLYEFKLL